MSVEVGEDVRGDALSLDLSALCSLPPPRGEEQRAASALCEESSRESH